MCQPLEEAGFGLLVSRQRPVEIEVLVGDVRHGGHVEVAAGHAVLGQPVGGDLQHGVGDPGLDHAGQVLLDVGWVGGGGVKAGVNLLLADAGVQRADHPGVEPGGAQDGVDEVDGGRLAVGAGDADEGHLAGGEVVPGGAQPAPGLSRLGNAHVDEGSPGQAGQLLRGSLAYDGHRTLRHRLGDETMAVHVDAGDGDEEIAGAHAARIDGDAMYLDVAANPTQDSG